MISSCLLVLATLQVPAPLPTPSALAPLAYETRAPGYGDRAEVGDRVTVHFLVQDADGVTLIDSEMRGLPYTFLLGQEISEQFWTTAVEGLRVGGQRLVTGPGALFGISSSEPSGTNDVTVVVRLVRVNPLKG